MSNFNISNDEVILLETRVEIESKDTNNRIDLTLTSKRILLEETIVTKVSLIKKVEEKILIDEIDLKDIKTFNGKIQVNQKSDKVSIQSTKENITLIFIGTLEAMKFVTKVTDAITNKTLTDRSFDAIKQTFNKVDDALGLDTRGTVKGIIENGIGSSLLKGIGKKKKK